MLRFKNSQVLTAATIPIYKIFDVNIVLYLDVWQSCLCFKVLNEVNNEEV